MAFADTVLCIPLHALLLLLVVSAWGALAADAGALLSADFEGDPLQSGWSVKPAKANVAAPAWADSGGHSGARCITAVDGAWLSPTFAIEPFAFYRLEFFSKAEGIGLWAAYFYDKDGNELTADCYASVYQSGAWLQNATCFRGRAKSVRARVAFVPQDGKRIWIGDVAVRPIERAAAAQWADELYATLPPLQYQPPAERWKLIPKAIEKLKAGKTLRIVLLGDSIVNDTSNSPWDALIERKYPGARIEVVISVRGGTGCGYYKDENRIKEYVLDHSPDLLIIGGISHGYDSESIRNVVKQVRAAGSPEIMIMSGAVANTDYCRAQFIKNSKPLAPEKAAEIADSFAARIRAVAAEETCEFLDMRTIWDDYMKVMGKPEEWFRRDIIHANDRGKQILGRVLERYFAP